ncbi:copper amine oxidase N-terminal domain-containing protein [Lysinibacillus antri]|uniref:Copper amine oxidase N-terminal domain-containing protein n=1 Tax=Lysinibacillus antri TaxID=2498145 RepID=A0A3S0P4L6_9BACI|nr:copper amine oxidase N-terminal domain-containing protein [Lysinibacillus antri]
MVLYLNSKTAIVNKKNKQLAVAPFTKNGTTLVPLRFISEELGKEVLWNANNKSITIK